MYLDIRIDFDWCVVVRIYGDTNTSGSINDYFNMGETDIRIPEKVLKYEEFINDCLKEDLKKVHGELDGVLSELSEYIQLKNIVETFRETNLTEEVIKTNVDVGCNFYIQANITDPANIMINVGCGHYVEFTLDEAIRFTEKRIAWLTKKSEILKKRSATTKAHIKLVLHGIQELEKIK